MAGDPKLTPLLNVEAVESSARFYREAFGLELTDSWSNEGRMRWAKLERGAFAMMLNEHGEGSAARRARGGHRDVVLYVAVDDADAVHAELVAKGLQPGEVNEETYALRQFVLRDPDGYELAVTSPITR